MSINSNRNIAIVCGGDSSEYEVSVRSARGLHSFFDHDRYNVYIVLVRGTQWTVMIDGEEPHTVDRNDFSFTDSSGRHVRFDYAYITIHGTPGENGIFQGYLDLLRIPYSTSNVLVEALTFDKFVLNNFLRAFGVTVPDSILLRRDDSHRPSDADIVARMGLPCFVKPVADGSSFGVTKVKTVADLTPALDEAFALCNDVMVERFVDGTEVTVGCYKTREKSVAFPVTEVVTHNEFFDYNAKYNGEVDEITPARISDTLRDKLQQETLRLYDLLHCNGIIRIDYIVTRDAQGDDVINLIEINTTPGMTATSFIPQQVRAAGLEMKDVLADIVDNQFVEG